MMTHSSLMHCESLVHGVNDDGGTCATGDPEDPGDPEDGLNTI